MEHGTQSWSLIIPPLHHIFINFAYNPSTAMTCLSTRKLGMNSHFHVPLLCFFLSSGDKTGGMVDRCLSQLPTCVAQIKPPLSLNDKNQREAAKVADWLHSWQSQHWRHLRAVVVPSQPALDHHSRRGRWNTVTAGSPLQCILTSLLSSSSSACSSDAAASARWHQGVRPQPLLWHQLSSFELTWPVTHSN